MAIFKQVCRAIFVLPLTAGNLKLTNLRQVSHDGSISGLIILTTLGAIVAEMMYIFKSDQHNKEHLAKPFLIALNVLGILTYMAVGVLERSRSLLLPSTETINLALKLKFLYLFCFGCLIYRVLKLVLHIKCEEFVHESRSYVIEILRDSFSALFYLVQAVFVCYFAKRQFRSSLYIFYSLVIISVVNISDWTHHEAVEHEETRNSYDICFYNNSNNSKKVFEIIKPFIEPTLLEYPLLCMIFLSQMWPNQENQLLDRPVLLKQDIRSNEIEDKLYETSLDNMRNIGDCTDFDRISENMPLDPQLHGNSNGQVRHLKTFCVLTCSALFSSPRIIIELLQIFGTLNKYFVLVSVVNITEHIVMVIAIMICFYALESQCRPCRGHNSYDIGNFFLIISFLVSTCVYTLHLMVYIFSDNHPSYNTSIHIAKESATIIELYFQTVYILQMRKYRILFQRNGLFSVRSTCLFLAFTNVGFWFSESFLIDQFIYKFQNPDYVRITTFDRFAFPFVTFYRFECFVSFFSLYKA